VFSLHNKRELAGFTRGKDRNLKRSRHSDLCGLLLQFKTGMTFLLALMPG